MANIFTWKAMFSEIFLITMITFWSILVNAFWWHVREFFSSRPPGRQTVSKFQWFLDFYKTALRIPGPYGGVCSDMGLSLSCLYPVSQIQNTYLWNVFAVTLMILSIKQNLVSSMSKSIDLCFCFISDIFCFCPIYLKKTFSPKNLLIHINFWSQKNVGHKKLLIQK